MCDSANLIFFRTLHLPLRTNDILHSLLFLVIKMPKLVTNFGLLRSVKAFFSGGVVQWSDDGRTLFMPCGAIVNTLDIDTGLPG